MRKLATIRKIAEIKPHTNADALELAIVDGWQVVVKKGEFRQGDLAVYFEVDSVLPVHPEFEFLRKSCYVNKDWVEGFRLKTIKLRGELSQGLLYPCFYSHSEGSWCHSPKMHYLPVKVTEGEDVTELYGVVKWDPPVPACLAGQVKGNFPSFMPKTDQERAQNLVTEIAESFANGDQYEVTIKLDGTSCTMYHNKGESGVCSRNLELKVNEENADNTLVKLFNKFASRLEAYGRNIAVQGEVMGPGVQGNRENLKDHEFFVFDIFDIDKQEYLSGDQKLDVIRSIGFTHVPVLEDLSFTVLPSGDVGELLKVAEGPSINHHVREGLVWKRLDGKFSFKTIANNFLLGEKE